MLVIKVLFVLLPLIALATGQRDWRFRRPSRFPHRVVPRPVHHSTRPTTLAPKPETTTEKLPIVTSTHRPSVSSTHSPPTRVPSIHKQPNIVWSKPHSTTHKPDVAVVVLPGDHSHLISTTTTSKPHYVFPVRPSTKPVNIPIVHESEALFSKSKPDLPHEPEHKVSSSSKPTTVTAKPESSTKPTTEIPKQESSSQKVQIKHSSSEVNSSTEANSGKPSETITPTSEAQPEITSTYLPPKPHAKPNHKPKHEVSPTPEPSKKPEVSTKPDISAKPLPSSTPESETSPASETSTVPESSQIPEVSSTPKVSVELVPSTTSVVSSKPTTISAPETSLEPEYSLAPEREPEVTSEQFNKSSVSPTELEPKISYKPSHISRKPEDKAQATSKPSVETEVSSIKPQAKEKIPSHNLRLKYIPGIGKSRNPTSATWSKPNWHSKSSKKPEHIRPGKSTPKPSFHKTIKPTTVISPEKSSLKPFSDRLPKARTSNDALDVFVLQDYHCREPNGYFAVPTQCDSFIECKTNKGRQLNCPDGLHFNPKSVWPEYPCGYPSEVKCGEHNEKQPPKPTADCPRQYGYFKSPSGNCGEYIMCLAGKAIEMSCPSGLAFNLATDACDWPSNVPSCSLDVFKGFTCPATETGEDGQPSNLTNKYRFKKSCKKYIDCERGSPRLLSCDEGLSFDDASKSCIDDEFVKDCS